MGALVRTVLGDVEPASLGMTLVHEHLVVDWGELQGRPKLAFDYEATVEFIAGRLGARRVLLVTDPILVKTGLAERVQAPLLSAARPAGTEARG